MEKVKGMINLIIESTTPLLNSWKSRIEIEGGVADIHIDDYLRSFSAVVISKACFSSNYAQGERIFLKLGALMGILQSMKGLSTGIPGLRYLPTRSNREGWRLEKEIRSLILEVVKERQKAFKASDHEKDFLHTVLEGAKNSDLSQEATQSFIVDNCKNIYLAGYETTAISATWCLMLLASNQEWRAEVLDICQGCTLDHADMLRKMKQLTMVIHESLRLYPSAPAVPREALDDLRFGNINIPKGVNIWTELLRRILIQKYGDRTP